MLLTMNRTLDEKIANVDRVYLTDIDLYNLERFANSFHCVSKPTTFCAITLMKSRSER